jgi:hypothetical protein
MQLKQNAVVDTPAPKFKLQGNQKTETGQKVTDASWHHCSKTPTDVSFARRRNKKPDAWERTNLFVFTRNRMRAGTWFRVPCVAS